MFFVLLLLLLFLVFPPVLMDQLASRIWGRGGHRAMGVVGAERAARQWRVLTGYSRSQGHPFTQGV